MERNAASMNPYADFAYIYDALMCQDIAYEEMADYIESVFAALPRRPELVLDLACGTGNLTGILSQRGYDMIGIDASVDMLNVAKKKQPDILYLCQDMREFELYGTVDAIVCMTDSLNYILDSDDLLTVFRLVKNYLNPGAPFIFDMNSEYKLSQIIADHTFTYDADGIFYVWENEWNAHEALCDFYLSFFVQADNGWYRRFDEAHTQRAYRQSEVERLLKEAGLLSVHVFDGYSKRAPLADSQRLVYVAR